MKKILIIIEEEKDLNKLRKVLDKRFRVNATTCSSKGVKLYCSGNFDVTLLSYTVKGVSVKAFLEIGNAFSILSPIIILTNSITSEEELDLLSHSSVHRIEERNDIRVIAKKIEKYLDNIKVVSTLLTSVKEKISIEENRHYVVKNNIRVYLTKKEFQVLKYFLENKNVIITREQMYQNVWNSGYESANVRLVDMLISKLRKKLKLRSLVSERGIGYYWNEKN